MSLLANATVACVRMLRGRASDHAGGYTEELVPDSTFYAAIVLNRSADGHVADAPAVLPTYTVLGDPAHPPLSFHDVFRREADGVLFLVTSVGADRMAPASASLLVRRWCVTAERYEEGLYGSTGPV